MVALDRTSPRARVSERLLVILLAQALRISSSNLRLQPVSPQLAVGPQWAIAPRAVAMWARAAAVSMAVPRAVALWTAAPRAVDVRARRG